MDYLAVSGSLENGTTIIVIIIVVVVFVVELSAPGGSDEATICRIWVGTREAAACAASAGWDISRAADLNVDNFN